MCGIAGCLALALEEDPDHDWVATATERISHRGPDDEGFYNDPDIAVGYKRLAIIDLSPGGHQPMRSADGRYWMVYNGEIYNYLELGAELRDQGVTLRTTCDSEVLLETYARVGKDVVHHLRGMYAFAIWDTWTRELFCARDPFGIKPFYYCIDPYQGAALSGAAPVGGGLGSGAPGGGEHGGGAPDGGGRGGRASGGGAPGGEAPAGGGLGGGAPDGGGRGGRASGGGAPGGEAPAGGGLGGGAPDGAGRGGRASGGGMPDGGTSGGGMPGGGAPGGGALGSLRGGRHAALPGAGGGQLDERYDWFAKPATLVRRPGRHAASLADGPGEALVGGLAPGAGREPDPSAPDGDLSRAPGGGLPGLAHGYLGPADGSAGPAGGSAGPAGGSGGTAPGSGGTALGSPGESSPGGESAGPNGGQGRPGRLLRFASERKALADAGTLRSLDPASLRRYLAFQYVPPPGTMTPPVRVLPPGHAMIARPGGSVDVYRYWRADLRPARAPSESTPRTILAAMRDSVAVHLRSDAPLGAFLSGGIDSAAICALAAEHRPDLLTFTVGFEREGYSEIDRAQETAAAIGVKSIPYVISPEEFFHHLPQIIWHLDDPMADAAAVPLWFVAREASKQVKVVLSGEGSDELFGGYAIYHQPGMVRAAERLPEWGRAPIRRAAAMIPGGVKGKGLLERTSTPLRHRYIGNARVFTGDQIDRLTGPGPASPWDVTGPVYDQAEEAELDDVSTMQLVDINTWLPGDILVKADRMTMAHSLELRVPFLDREVMAVAARLAREEKIGSGTTKLALRMAMSEVLPKAAAERAKLGFPVPIGHWLKGDAYGFAERVLREAQTGQWVNRQAALGLLQRFRAGEPDVTWRHLWVLIVFSLWHQIFVERAYDPVALGWERVAGLPR